MAVDIEAKEASMDVFIHDIIAITIDDPSWVESSKSSELLVIHTVFRPLHSSKILKQDYPLSLCKLPGEGRLAEHKTCLGWDIQTCSLRVFIHKEKETAWEQDIRASISLTKIKTHKLKFTIRNLNLSAHLITQ